VEQNIVHQNRRWFWLHLFPKGRWKKYFNFKKNSNRYTYKNKKQKTKNKKQKGEILFSVDAKCKKLVINDDVAIQKKLKYFFPS